MLGGRMGQIALFVFVPTWREDAIKFTPETASWPPVYRVLLEERCMVTSPAQSASLTSISGAATANLPLPIVTNIQGLKFSETGGWHIVRPHDDRITQIEYIEEFRAILSSSYDGTIKISPVEYCGHALDVGKSVVIRQDDLKTHERTFLAHGGKPVNGFVYNQDSLTVFSWGWNREILEWSPHNVSKVIRKFYIGASVRSASILRGSAHQHLVVVTVPKHDHRGSDTQMEQKLRIFDIVGGDLCTRCRTPAWPAKSAPRRAGSGLPSFCTRVQPFFCAERRATCGGVGCATLEDNDSLRWACLAPVHQRFPKFGKHRNTF